MASINFTASYIMPATIKVKDRIGSHTEQASIIEFNEYDMQDRITVSKVNNNWGRSLAIPIYEMAYSDSIRPKTRLFGVTTQTDSFKKIEPDKVLGLSLISNKENDKKRYLYFLQVAPNEISPAYFENEKKKGITKLFPSNKKRKRKYKGIGSSMIKSMQTVFPDKPIALHSVPQAVEFYKKHGFKEIEQKTFITRMEWTQ